MHAYLKFRRLPAPRTDFSRPTRRPALCCAVGVLIMIINTACSDSTAKSGSSSPKTNKPNIVFILADDLGYGDVGCFGQKRIKTPSLDRMASEGLRFTDAYAGAPVCA